MLEAQDNLVQLAKAPHAEFKHRQVMWQLSIPSSRPVLAPETALAKVVCASFARESTVDQSTSCCRLREG